MSKRASARAKSILKDRQADFDRLKDQRPFKKPGSLNPRKTGGASNGYRKLRRR